MDHYEAILWQFIGRRDVAKAERRNCERVVAASIFNRQIFEVKISIAACGSTTYNRAVVMCQCRPALMVFTELSFNLWPWNTLRQCPLTWWLFVQSFIRNPFTWKEITHHADNPLHCWSKHIEIHVAMCCLLLQQNLEMLLKRKRWTSTKFSTLPLSLINKKTSFVTWCIIPIVILCSKHCHNEIIIWFVCTGIKVRF